MTKKTMGAVLVALILIVMGAGQVWAQQVDLRVVRVSPDRVRQIRIYQNPMYQNNTIVMQVWLSKHVRGKKGAGGLIYNSTQGRGGHNGLGGYYQMARIAQMLKNGTITGIIYDPRNSRIEHNAGYFERKGKGWLKYPLYMIQGFYFGPGVVDSDAPPKPKQMQGKPQYETEPRVEPRDPDAEHRRLEMERREEEQRRRDMERW